MKKLLIYITFILLLTQCSFVKPRPRSFDNKITEIGDIQVALVLGGGGSKGFAHVGAIEVLEENNIPIDLIVGSSAGSAVGAIYADNKDIKKTKEILIKASNRQLLDFSLFETLKIFITPSSPIIGQSYENFIYDNLTAKSFHELKIPLIAVTVDAVSGEKFIIKDGPIAPAIRASSAVPPVIAPALLYGRILIDGGVIEPVPVETAKKFKPKMIIAIDINNAPPKTKPRNLLELSYRALWISYYNLSRMQSAQADIDIHPDLNGHGLFEDHRKEELYQLGRKAALQALPQIQYKLKKIGISKTTNP
jgi:NTE family protein